MSSFVAPKVDGPVPKPGLQRTVLLLAIIKPARLYVTDAVLAEYREVLARPAENPQGTPAAAPQGPFACRLTRAPAPRDAGLG